MISWSLPRLSALHPLPLVNRAASNQKQDFLLRCRTHSNVRLRQSGLPFERRMPDIPIVARRIEIGCRLATTRLADSRGEEREIGNVGCRWQSTVCAVAHNLAWCIAQFTATAPCAAALRMITAPTPPHLSLRPIEQT